METPKTEAGLMRLTMVALSDAGHMVFRGNVGLMFTKDGRPIRTGLPNGFSDVFGYRAGDARAFFIEVKTKTGAVRKEQTAFLAAMRSRGAIAGIARSVEGALNLVAGDA